MGYKVLYRKYRPNDFNELVGQRPIKEALINAIIKNQLSHAYIFTGPRGTGKTSMAKIFAKALTCLNPKDGICCNGCTNCLSFNENPDIIEIDAASNNGVDEIREIRNNVKLVPTMSKYKIYIVDEVHMLSNSAWNAFLKTLEEPPAHVIFIFATTEINKVPVTVLSRCQRYDFHKINKEDIKKHIINIANKENFVIDEDAINEVIKLSDGCLRDALSYLDQLSKVSNEINIELVSSVFGIASLSYIKELIGNVYNNSLIEFLSLLNKIKFDGIDCNSLINNIIDYLMSEAIKIKKRTSQNFTFDFCYDLVKDMLEIQKGIKFIDNPYNALEITLLSYFDDNKVVVNDLKETKDEIKGDEKTKIISREIIPHEKKEKNNNNIFREINFSEKLKEIRVNNVFCGANKELKIKFCNLWKEFTEVLEDVNNYSLLGFIENVIVEVVSSDYVLFSTKINSDSVLFNDNLNIIELEFNKFSKLDYKFISLNSEEWKLEKENFIRNKNINRKLISEDVLKNENEAMDTSVDAAQDIFGDIIEVN